MTPEFETVILSGFCLLVRSIMYIMKMPRIHFSLIVCFIQLRIRRVSRLKASRNYSHFTLHQRHVNYHFILITYFLLLIFADHSENDISVEDERP